jgi:hypothetical protein
LVATAAAIVFAIRLVGNPLVLFTNATASLVATSAPQDGTGQSMPIIQSIVGDQALPPTAREASTGDEIAAAFNTADQSQTENPQPPAEALFKKYQAWAAEEECTDTPATTARTRCPAQFVQNAQARVRPVQNAQAQERSVQNSQAPLPEQSNDGLH